MKLRPWFVVLFSAACLWLNPAGAPTLRAADAPAVEEARQLRQELELARREVERLRRDNERLRAELERLTRRPAPAGTPAPDPDRELKQLKAENEQLRRQQQESQSTIRAITPAKPARPMTELAPVQNDTVVEADELAGHFAEDAAAATLRYSRKTFRVKGRVDRFGSALVTRDFTVLFEGAGRAVRVKCRFNYIGKYRSVFTTHEGRKLVARLESGRETTLLEAGQEVTIQGRCQGLKDAEVVLTASELVR